MNETSARFNGNLGAIFMEVCGYKLDILKPVKLRSFI
jgi:hypothetical protein